MSALLRQFLANMKPPGGLGAPPAPTPTPAVPAFKAPKKQLTPPKPTPIPTSPIGGVTAGQPYRSTMLGRI